MKEYYRNRHLQYTYDERIPERVKKSMRVSTLEGDVSVLLVRVGELLALEHVQIFADTTTSGGGNENVIDEA